MPKKLFITISPPNRQQYYARLKFKNPLRCVFLDDKLAITSVLSKWRIKRYVFYPELDDKGRLHYHGRMDLTPSQEVTFYKSIKPHFERIGFVDNSPIKHDVENLIYCMKSWGKTREILELDHPITPQFILHTVGGRKGFKSRDRDLDAGLPASSISIVEYLEGLSPKDT